MAVLTIDSEGSRVVVSIAVLKNQTGKKCHSQTKQKKTQNQKNVAKRKKTERFIKETIENYSLAIAHRVIDCTSKIEGTKKMENQMTKHFVTNTHAHIKKTQFGAADSNRISTNE